MTLTTDQLTALKQGEAVRVREDGMECVVVRADVYDRRCAQPYDDSEWTSDELSRIAERMFDDMDSAEAIP